MQNSIVEYNNYNNSLTELLDKQPGFDVLKLDYSSISQLTNIPTIFHMKSISSINERCNIVLVRGTVIRTGIAKVRTFWVKFRCLSCQSEHLRKFDPTINEIEPPKQCQCKGNKFIKVSESELNDYQEIKLQDTYTKVQPGAISNSIRVILEGDLVNRCRTGNDLIVGGFVTQRWKGKKTDDITLWIYAKYLKLKNGFEPILDNPICINSRDELLKNFSTELYNLDQVKLAIILCLLGGVSRTVNGTNIRGDSHLLIVGETGTGKSCLLRGVQKIIERCSFVNGIGVSQAGLTVGFSREGKDWTIDARALALADMGVCCIDEFDLIPRELQQSILEAMEQQTISSSKAGLVTKLNARTTIIAAASPINHKYIHQIPINDNLNISSPLFSRFDLIFVLVDHKDHFLDQQLCDHILSNQKKKEMPQEMKQYLAHCKKINPQLTNDIESVIQKYYYRLRQLYPETTIRKFESMIRLSQAHAKLCCREFTNKFDIVVVIALNEYTRSTGLKIQDVLRTDCSIDDIDKAWDLLSKM